MGGGGGRGTPRTEHGGAAGHELPGHDDNGLPCAHFAALPVIVRCHTLCKGRTSKIHHRGWANATTGHVHQDNPPNTGAPSVLQQAHTPITQGQNAVHAECTQRQCCRSTCKRPGTLSRTVQKGLGDGLDGKERLVVAVQKVRHEQNQDAEAGLKQGVLVKEQCDLHDTLPGNEAHTPPTAHAHMRSRGWQTRQASAPCMVHSPTPTSIYAG
jgi:hypothetical protein